MLTPWARFDDFQAGTTVVCPPATRVLAAHRTDQVAQVLTEVDRATRAGRWAFGYLSYEAAPGLDASLVTHEPAPQGPPLAWFGICDQPARTPLVEPLPAGGADHQVPSWRPASTKRDYLHRVERIRRRIAEGMTYQCNLTDQMLATFTGDPLSLYAELASAQRGAHACYLDTGRYVLASASPELFFSWSGERMALRPMKGTSPRGREQAEDAELAARLRASAKERAENVMIVDLLRNDVSRIARTSTVRVPALFTVERYPTVLQLTSEITASVPASVSLLEVFRALFPCGSVTGAPKPATMRLIRELEPTPRGVYCGAIGLVGPPTASERARFNVAIRTVLVDRRTGRAGYGTGGAITWPSDASGEHAELVVKSAILSTRNNEFQLRETMAYLPESGLRHKARHLERLARSASYFGYSFDDTAISTQLDLATRDAGPCMVRLGLRRDGTAEVSCQPLPPHTDQPVGLAVDPEPIDSTQPWPYHKTSRRDPYTIRRERHPYADDVLLVNERGEVTESTIANLAVRLAGRWWTPPLSSGCLPGVERQRLVEDGTLAERVIWVTDVTRAESLALVSSVRGWRPAKFVETHR